MQKLELFDETFDPDRTESYSFAIQVSLNGFSFCVKDESRNIYIGLVEFPFEYPVQFYDDWANRVHDLNLAYPWLKKGFQKISFCYDSPVFTVVPNNFFIAEKAKGMLSTVHPIDENDEIRFTIHGDSFVNIYSIPSLLVSEWTKNQKKTSFFGSADSLINFILIKSNSYKGKRLAIAFYDGYSNIMLLSNGCLVFIGSIPTYTADDTCYHLVNISQKLNIPTNDVSLSVLGYFEHIEQFKTICGKVFGNIVQESTLEQDHFSYLISKYKGKYANLFNQSLCE